MIDPKINTRERKRSVEGVLAAFVPIEPFRQKKKASRERLTWCFWSG